MARLLAKTIIVIVLSSVALCQTAPGDTIYFSAPAPPPVSSVSFTITGPANGVIYYYWVIAQYPGGAAVPPQAAIVYNGPSTLSAFNYITLNWAPVGGATSYDVLRTPGPKLPASGICTCAVATGVSGTMQSDTGGSLANYTISAKPAATGYIQLDNSGSRAQFVSNPSLSGGGGSTNCSTLTVASGAVTVPFSNTADCYSFTITAATTATLSIPTGGVAGPWVLKIINSGPVSGPNMTWTPAGGATASGFPNTIDSSANNAGTALTVYYDSAANAFFISSAVSFTAGALSSGQIFAQGSAGIPVAATAANIVSTFTSCSGTQYLGADGACHTASGGGGGFPLPIVQQAAYSSNNTTSFTVTFPQAAAATGNTLFMFVSADHQTVTTPTGWTVDIDRSTGSYSQFIMLHKASAGDTSATFTVGASATFAVYFVELSGSHALDKSVAGTGGAGATYIPQLTITPSAGAAVFVFYCGPDNGSTLYPPLDPDWRPIQIVSVGGNGRSIYGVALANGASGAAINTPQVGANGVILYSGDTPAYYALSIL